MLRFSDILIAVVLVIVLVKVFLSPIIYSSTPVGDEIYYIGFADSFLYKKYIPSTNYTVKDDTIVINYTGPPGNIFLGYYDWFNIEHPILGKLIIMFLYLLFTGNLFFMRLSVLIVSLTILFLFLRKLRQYYGVLVLFFFTVVFIIDNMVVHYFYLLLLDTFIVQLVMLSIIFFLERRDIAVIITLSLAVAVKEYALIIVFSYALYYLLEEKKHFTKTLIYPIFSLVLSYIPNIVYTIYHQGINFIKYMLRSLAVKDPLSCKVACFYPLLRIDWGFISFSPIILYVWLFLLPLVVFKGRLSGRRIIPYLISTNILLANSIISLLRSVYIYYYVIPVLLTPIILSEITIYVYESAKPLLNPQRI